MSRPQLRAVALAATVSIAEIQRAEAGEDTPVVYSEQATGDQPQHPLLQFDADAENCDACYWSGVVCPYHQGIHDGVMRYAKALFALAYDPDLSEVLYGAIDGRPDIRRAWERTTGTATGPSYPTSLPKFEVGQELQHAAGLIRRVERREWTGDGWTYVTASDKGGQLIASERMFTAVPTADGGAG